MTGRRSLVRVVLLAALVLMSFALAFRVDTATSGQRYMDPSLPTAERVQDLLSQMTLAEKVGQMDQILIDHVTQPASSPACPGCFGDPDPAAMQLVLLDDNVGSLLAGGTDMPIDTSHSGGLGNTGRDWAVTYNKIQLFAIQHSRLHIPVLFGIDAVHGFSHPVDAPLFPHGVGMGATWDPAAAQMEGTVSGAALRATGWLEDFAPVQDVERDNRWGRAHEPWSEEPALAGQLGAAFIGGLQSAGTSAASNGNPLRAAATIKHFAGNSESINGHDRVEGQLSIRHLQDLFLPAYTDSIEAGAKMAMVSSSSLNGVPATGSHFLQTALLRQRLGFTGVTISDYKDVQALATIYHVAPDAAGAIALAVNAGLDMAMWVDDPGTWQSGILADVQNEKIAPSRIDEAVSRILALKFELGLFDQPCVRLPGQPCVDVDAAVETVQAGRQATLQSARESITLLKNANNLLPLAIGTKLVVTGPNADSMVAQLGGWSVSWQGLSGSGHSCCEGPPGMVPPGTTVAQGFHAIDPSVVLARSQQDAVSSAKSADAIVAVVGEHAYAEGYGDDPAPALAADQKALLAALESTGKPVIVVVMAGRPLGLGQTNELNASALLMAYQGSSEAGQAVADVIYGVVNPTGKLPISWPTDVDTRASSGDGDGTPTAASPLGDQPKPFDLLPSTSEGSGSSYNPLFTFGFGLSFTTFQVEGLTVSAPSARDGLVTVSFTATNTGDRDGTDTIPVFVRQPTAPVVLPPHRLVAFGRVDLQAGQTRPVTVQFPTSRLALTPGDMDSSAAPVVIAGEYTVEVPTQPAPSNLFPDASPPLESGFNVN